MGQWRVRPHLYWNCLEVYIHGHLFNLSSGPEDELRVHARGPRGEGGGSLNPFVPLHSVDTLNFSDFTINSTILIVFQRMGG